MPEVEHFVNNMKQNMETDVMFITADKTKLIMHRHANNINRSGKNTNSTIPIKFGRNEMNVTEA